MAVVFEMKTKVGILILTLLTLDKQLSSPYTLEVAIRPVHSSKTSKVIGDRNYS